MMSSNNNNENKRRALVVGCTGVAGSALVSRLIADSEVATTWAEIIGLSRDSSARLEVTKRSKTASFVVRFISADLKNSNAQELAKQIGSDIIKRISHIFFCAWTPVSGKAPSSEEEYKLNCEIFDNFLNAVVLVRKNDAPTTGFPRLLLLEGTKSYGIHLGPRKFSDYRVPFEEDNYVRHPTPPNFYFGWEDNLKKRQWPEWVALRPGPIIGVSVQRSSFFNFGTAFAVFLSLLKSLGRQMAFPNPASADIAKDKVLDMRHDFVESTMVASELVWLALLPAGVVKGSDILDATGTPAVNCSSGACLSWRKAWPQLATRLDMKSTLDCSFDLLKFVGDGEVQQHWAHLVDKYSLITPQNLSEVVVWPAFLGTLTRPYDSFASVARARRLGFSETTDPLDMFCSVFTGLQTNKVIPPILIKT